MQITGPPERAFFNKLNRRLKMKRFRVLLCTLLSVLFYVRLHWRTPIRG